MLYFNDIINLLECKYLILLHKLQNTDISWVFWKTVVQPAGQSVGSGLVGHSQMSKAGCLQGYMALDLQV